MHLRLGQAEMKFPLISPREGRVLAQKSHAGWDNPRKITLWSSVVMSSKSPALEQSKLAQMASSRVRLARKTALPMSSFACHRTVQ